MFDDDFDPQATLRQMKRQHAQLRRGMLEVAAGRFAHPAKVATLLARIGEWNLPAEDRVRVAIAAAFVLAGDVQTFDRLVADVRRTGWPFP